jgi:hypothetical protein
MRGSGTNACYVRVGSRDYSLKIRHRRELECNLITTVGEHGRVIVLSSKKVVKSVEKPASDLQNRLEERCGVLPNFFRLARETSDIIEKLWGFAQAAYLDNPLPSVFKERLFVSPVAL